MQRIAANHVALIGPPGAHARSFVLGPGGACDRSPCGTGASAWLACPAAGGALAPGEPWIQERVRGTRFAASYRRDGDAVLPRITGSAHPLRHGIRVPP